jgi:hypothetical protein
MWHATGTERSQLSYLRGGLTSAVVPEEGEPRQGLHFVAAFLLMASPGIVSLVVGEIAS